MSNFKKTIKNVFYGILNQLVGMSLAILIPRLFILNYGSEVNGLFMFIAQVFTYFALLEAGLGVATIQALYKPIAVKDHNTISVVLSTSRIYYSKVTLNYLVGVLLFAIVYPFVLKSNIGKITVFIVILLQGLAGVVNFKYQIILKQLILADGKGYVISNITLLVSVLNSVSKIALMTYGVNIIAIQIAFLLISLLQTLFVKYYFKKHYPWVMFNLNPDFNLLKEKSAILIHQISGLVFSGTNIVILSIFSDLKTVSIYATYNLIVYSVNTFSSTINTSFQFVIGQLFHTDWIKFIKLFDMYNKVLITLIYSLITVIYFMLDPFIFLYTAGADINYYVKNLALLFCIVQLLDANRMFSSNLIVISGHMKKTLRNTIFEAFLNLSSSLILVNYMGIYGVLIGTIIALVYRSNDIIIYTSKNILKRGLVKSYLPILLNSVLFFIAFLIKERLKINIISFGDFVFILIKAFFLIFAIYLICNYLFFKKEMNWAISKLFKLVLK